MKKLLALLLSLSSIVTVVTAQTLISSNHLRFENITIEDGLPGTSTHSFMQDRLGRLWIGTFRGLVCYDGTNFTTFSHNPEDSTGLQNNFVTCLFEDKAGNIWVGTMFAGVSKYNPLTQQFTHFPFNSKTQQKDNAIIWPYISAIEEDDAGNIWVGTMNGLSRIEFQEINQQDSFLITSYYPELYPESFLHNVVDYSKTFPSKSILKIGNQQNSTQSFEIQKETTVLIVGMGEYVGKGRFADFGWLENEAGQKVWEMFLEKSFQDGANYKKRLQANLITLPKGNYQLHFLSDDNFSYNNFLYPKEVGPYNLADRKPLPEHDELWGIQVLFLDKENIEQTTSVLEKIKAANSISNGRVYCSFKDEKGQLWWGTAQGLNKVVASSHSDSIYFEHYLPSSKQGRLRSDVITQIQQRNEKEWWITGLAYPEDEKTYGLNLETYQPQQEVFNSHYYFPKVKNFAQILELENGAIWVASFGDGLFQLIENNAGSQQPYSAQRFPLSTPYTWQLFQDVSATVWLGTWQGGGFKLNSSVNKYSFYSLSEQSKNNDDYIIRAVLEDKQGNFWLGTQNAGLFKYYKGSHQIEQFDTAGGICNNGILSLEEDAEGTIWIGTQSGLSRFEPKTKQFQNYYHQKNNPNSLLDHKGIKAITKDRQDNIWIGTLNGLHLYQSETNDFKRFELSQFKKEWNHDRINTIEEDDFGNLWIAYYFNGLLKINIQELLSGQIQTPLQTILPKKDIRHLQIAGNDLWFSDAQTGFFHYDIKTNSRKYFTKEDGLIHSNITSIIFDNDKKLWLNTSGGLVQFNTENQSFRSYTKEDGIELNIHTPGSSCFTNNGNILTGVENGFYLFHPDSLKPHPIAPSVILVDFKVDNQSIAIGEDKPLNVPIGFAQDISLDYHQNSISIDYSGVHFDNPKQLIYAYKLEGFDAEWREVEKETKARYVNLPPGTYSFQVKAANKNGNFGEPSKALTIKILPPWWRTIWFYSILGLLFVTLLYLAYRFQLTRQLEKAEALRLKELDELKNRFFINVAHELRTPLTLILGPLSSIMKRADVSNRSFGDLKLMKQNGKTLLKLINEILDLSKLEAGKLELQEKTVSIYQMVQRIVSAFESGAQFRGIQLSFSADFNRHLQVLVDVSKIEKILYNLIANALKFTPKGGEISVTAHDKDNSIEVQVRDTGKGIDPDDLPYIFDRYYQSKKPEIANYGGTGVGLALSRQLAQLLGGNLSAKSVVNKGSTFILTFPKKVVLGVPEEKVEVEKIFPIYGEDIETDVESVLDEEPVSTAVSSSSTVRILVVEDNPDMQRYISSVLSTKYEVLLAENGKEALEILTADGGRQTVDGRPKGSSQAGYIGGANDKAVSTSSNQQSVHRPPSTVHRLPSLIISDVMMPVMDGFALLEALKANEEWRSIPVVMLTARIEKASKLKALRIGVDDYLSKPFEQDELLVRIENLLNNYQKRLVTKAPAVSAVLAENVSDNGVKKKQKEAPRISKEDAAWLEDFEKRVGEELGNPQMTVLSLAYDLHISERQLYRKIKQLTGLSPKKYVQEVRLQTARNLLETNECSTVKEACYSVGFKKVRYFSELFNKRFGKNPSEFL